MRISCRLITAVLLMATSSLAFAQSAVPLGSPKYLPTPEESIGWRGDGTGRYPGATPPTIWSRKRSVAGYETKGILWATPLPEQSAASPIVVGKSIFVTSENTDLVCLDKSTGRILWIRSNPEFEGLSDEERKADPGYEKLALLLPQLAKANADTVEELNAQQAAAATAGPHAPGPALANKRKLERQIWDQQLAIYKKDGYHRYGSQGVFGYAAQTPVSDGTRVCAYYSTGISVCYDLDGKRAWIHQKQGGGPEHGNFCSPILWGNRLVVWGQDVRAYDVDTGKLAWTGHADNAYGSLLRLQSGNDLVVGTALGRFFRLRDGQPIWGDAGFGSGIPTPIVEGNVVVAHSDQNNRGTRTFKLPPSTDGGKLQLIATLKAGWTEEELREKDFQRGLVASPLFVDGLIYNLTEGGGLLVNNATTGELMYRKVLPMKSKTAYWDWAGASASPTLAGKYIYLMDNQGTTVVIEPGPTYKQVAVNLLEESKDGKNQSQNLTTPVFDGTRMYYRTPGYLYCIGEK